jgi:hypothetical protein
VHCTQPVLPHLCIQCCQQLLLVLYQWVRPGRVLLPVDGVGRPGRGIAHLRNTHSTAILGKGQHGTAAAGKMFVAAQAATRWAAISLQSCYHATWLHLLEPASFSVLQSSMMLCALDLSHEQYASTAEEAVPAASAYQCFCCQFHWEVQLQQLHCAEVLRARLNACTATHTNMRGVSNSRGKITRCYSALTAATSASHAACCGCYPSWLTGQHIRKGLAHNQLPHGCCCPQEHHAVCCVTSWISTFVHLVCPALALIPARPQDALVDVQQRSIAGCSSIRRCWHFQCGTALQEAPQNGAV